MPDNWSFVVAAYGLTAVVLTLYWRHLVRRERQLDIARSGASSGDRSRQPSRAGHPCGEPTSRQSLQ